jgi:hypothetical protein
MLLSCVSFDRKSGAIKFAVASETAISCCLGRQYRPVLSLSFLDSYVLISLASLPDLLSMLGLVNYLPNIIFLFKRFLSKIQKLLKALMQSHI